MLAVNNVLSIILDFYFPASKKLNIIKYTNS